MLAANALSTGFTHVLGQAVILRRVAAADQDIMRKPLAHVVN